MAMYQITLWTGINALTGPKIDLALQNRFAITKPYHNSILIPDYNPLSFVGRTRDMTALSPHTLDRLPSLRLRRIMISHDHAGKPRIDQARQGTGSLSVLIILPLSHYGEGKNNAQWKRVSLEGKRISLFSINWTQFGTF